ncbi:MAG: SDR family NAD(P)-dependent oxidoreductase, partial [Phycisphaerales bacterium]
MDLNAKIVLVTGGAGGIGLGIGKAFAAEGCKVALADRDEEGLAKAVETAGAESAFPWRTCDITDRGQVSKLFQWLGDELGPVDILVNSAGINVANRMMSNIDPAD